MGDAKEAQREVLVLLEDAIRQPDTVFLPGFSTLGFTGPIKKLKWGHEGEKRVTV